MLTNFQTIRASIDRLKKLEETMADPEMIKALTKKEMSDNGREPRKADAYAGRHQEYAQAARCALGYRYQKEDIAVAEANRLGIPVAAVVDTNLRPPT